jgi:predicted kinase
MKPSLIIVIGMSGSGKTTLSRKLSHELKFPLVSKDDLKIMMFDALGWKDRRWSIKVGNVCYQIMDYLIEEQLKAGLPIIAESTFNAQFAVPTIQKWQDKYGIKTIQVHCHTDPRIARQRFIDRMAEDMAHPTKAEGHEALQNFDERLRDDTDQPLDIKSKIISVDTTDFTSVHPKKIAQEIRTYLGA